jgi:hypothetical protein
MQYIESDTVMFVAVIALVGWLYWLHHKRRLQQSELRRAQLRTLNSALEKFGSAGEFVDFVQSKEGQILFSIIDSSEANPPRAKIRFAQIGILLVCVGVGLFIGASGYQTTAERDLREVLIMMDFTGTVAMSMGIGLLAVAFVTLLWERWFGGSASEQT